MTTKLTDDTERWLRSNAELYRRKGNGQMARNFEMCAEDMAKALAEIAAMKEAARPVVKNAQKILGVHAYAVRKEQLDALAALVGEE